MTKWRLQHTIIEVVAYTELLSCLSVMVCASTRYTFNSSTINCVQYSVWLNLHAGVGFKVVQSEHNSIVLVAMGNG